MRDLLWALRGLRKNPLFTIAVTAILGLGIGATTAVFSIVDAVLLRPLPYQSSGRLVRIEELSPKSVVRTIRAANYLTWRGRSDLFEKTLPYRKDFVTLTNVSAPDQIFSVRTAAELFTVLGVHARLGRPLSEADDELNAPNVAVLSDRLWRRLFHADPTVIGRAITLSDELYTIIGVMPPEFEYPNGNIEMWLPLRLTSAFKANLEVVAQMKLGLSAPQVQSAMQAVARQLEKQDPENNAGLRLVVSPWTDTLDRQYELSLVFILAAVGMVLLIACANVGGLLLSRAVQREKEIAIRAALGAGFWRVVRQLLAESFVLGVIGSSAGIIVARYALQFLLKRLVALPIVVPHIQRVALNGRVLAFDTAICILLACLCSLAPVLFASRTDVQASLRGGHGTGPRRSTRLFSILIASETAFAFLLLVGSGLLLRSLIRLQQADNGFHAEHVLTMRVPIGTLTRPQPGGKYESRERQTEFYRQVLDRMERVPGVKAAAVVNNLPLSGTSTSTIQRGSDGSLTAVMTRTISSQYFAVLGTPLLKGRIFSDADQDGAPPVAIINEYLAHQLFPDRDPIGRFLPGEDEEESKTAVVGVVKNSWQMSYDQPVKGEVYIPYRQFMFGTFLSTMIVRTAGDPLSLADTLRKEVWAVDPNEPVIKVETMDDVIADSIWRPRFSSWVFSVLGGLALLLTSAGIYGVVAYTSMLRAREVGIRVALGASPRNVVAVILRSAMMPLCAGLGVSLVAALLLARLLKSLLYEVSGADPVTYLAAAALLVATGVLASTRPAWRAAARDPLTALRTE